MNGDNMTMKEQFNRMKENWLIVLLLLVIVGIPFFQTSGVRRLTAPMMEVAEMAVEAGYAGGYAKSAPSYIVRDEGFAPEVEDRIITKSSSLSTEVERGTFSEAETKVKSIIKSSDSFLLNENVYASETGWKSYKHGSYQIKVETEKYNSVVTQLKDIGEVKSFSENADDITKRYTDLNVGLKAEKERLERYQKMYNEAKETEDKIQLSDRIFNQERTIKYLERAIKNMDNKVSYSTVYLTVNEKRSEYVNVVFVKISELVRAFVGSVNLVLKTIFIVIPWAVGMWLVVIVSRLFRKKK